MTFASPGPDEAELKVAFDGLTAAIAEAGFALNDEKTRDPAAQIDIFNCSLENGSTAVLPARIDEFFAKEREPAAIEAFDTYCDIVQSKTWRVGDARKRRRKAHGQRKNAATAAAALVS